MKKCPNCNHSLEDDALFCDSCGTKQPEEPVSKPEEAVLEEKAEFIFCPNCGTKCSGDSAFCDNCGNSLAEKHEIIPQSAGVPDTVIPKTPDMTAQAKRENKKLIPVIGVAAVLAVILICAAVFFILTGGSKKAALYVKDYELFYTNFSGKPVQLTENFVSGMAKDEVSGSAEIDSNNSVNMISKDGKKVVYFDDVSHDSNEITMSLYYRNMKSGKSEPVKIDKLNLSGGNDETTIKINENGDMVTYTRGRNSDGMELYQYDVKSDEKSKLASDARDVNISKDGNTVYFTTAENNLYIKEKGKDKEKLDSEVGSLSFTKDYKTVYYLKEGKLYKKQVGKEKEKIASDVYSIEKVYDNGRIYYLKEETDSVKLSDYVKNDLDLEGTDKEYVDGKLSEYTMDVYEVSVCYYDGKEEKVLGKANRNYYYTSSESINTALDKPVIAFKNITDKDEVSKVSLVKVIAGDYGEDGAEPGSYVNAYLDYYSVIDDPDSLRSRVIGALEDSTGDFEYSVFDGSDLKGILPETATNLWINPDGDSLNFFEDVDDKGYGDLYVAKAKGGFKPELKDSDVYNVVYFYKDGLFYSKDRSESDYSYSLFKDKEKIDDDITNMQGNEEGAFVYIKDGDIYLYKKGKKEKIGSAGDMLGVSAGVSKGKFIYLADYSSKYYSGELYLYNKGKNEKIDDDVSMVLSTNFDVED